MSRRHPDRVAELNRALAEVLDRFVRLEVVDEGVHRVHRVHAVFRDPSGEGDALVSYGISNLSDREMALVQLYALAYLGMEPGRVLCIDAPMAPLHPADTHRWLQCAMERAQRHGTQLVIVANGAEAVRDMPEGALRSFERPDGGPAIVR